ncbi:MAG: hypothetical protein JHD16_07435 [Solirubrobacteraceae bacterium]|nr:hypothetical protein [Solirubrobacteraceae bacterium]
MRYPAGAPAREGFSRMGLDRPVLQRTPGLRFWRLLGTGDGGKMTVSADFRRWALLAFWRSDEDLDAFLASSEIPRRWDDLGAERYDLRLATARAHGSWGRAHFNVDRAAPLIPGAPVAILTHAAIRPQRLARFWEAVPRPALDLAAHPEHLASLGIGDVPIFRQATFSLWRSLAGAQDFAYRRAAHREVIDRTRTEDWYSSELFARFQPLSSSGTWDGRDPLVDLGSAPGPERGQISP